YLAPAPDYPGAAIPKESFHAQGSEEAASALRTFRRYVPLSRNLRDLLRAAQEKPPARGDNAQVAQHRAPGGRALADRPDLGHLLPRRDGALCLPQPRVRAVLARQPAAPRHVPEWHQIRGRDNRDDRTDARRGAGARERSEGRRVRID